jgi:AcrR family transcriptional regulator
VARGRSFREDLLEMMESLRPGNDPRAEWLWNIFGGATKHPALARQYQRQVIEPRREALRDLFRRGIESGDLSPDTDIEVSISMVVGAIHMRARSHDPDDKLPPDFVKRLLQTLLTGIEAR